MPKPFTAAPIRTPLTDSDGYVVSGSQWPLWFTTLYQILSGFNSWSGYPAGSAPTVTGGGGMTIASEVVNHAEFQQVGTFASIYLDLSFTTGGVASNYVAIVLPVAPAGYGALNARLIQGGVMVPAVAFINAGLLQVEKADGSNLALAASQIFIGGSFHSA
jgi:hypothetical protein